MLYFYWHVLIWEVIVLYYKSSHISSTIYYSSYWIIKEPALCFPRTASFLKQCRAVELSNMAVWWPDLIVYSNMCLSCCFLFVCLYFFFFGKLQPLYFPLILSRSWWNVRLIPAIFSVFVTAILQLCCTIKHKQNNNSKWLSRPDCLCKCFKVQCTYHALR